MSVLAMIRLLHHAVWNGDERAGSKLQSSFSPSDNNVQDLVCEATDVIVSESLKSLSAEIRDEEVYAKLVAIACRAVLGEYTGKEQVPISGERIPIAEPINRSTRFLPATITSRTLGALARVVRHSQNRWLDDSRVFSLPSNSSKLPAF